MDRAIKKKTFTLKRVLLISVIIIPLSVAVSLLAFSDKSAKLNVRSEEIIISTVTKGPFQEFIPVTGKVIPIKTVYLDVSEGGRVERKYVEAGILINKGDKILQLSNTNLMLNIMLREAELFAQTNSLRQTRLAMEQYRLELKAKLSDIDYQIKAQKRLYDRNKRLAEENIISASDYEKINDKYDHLLELKELTSETFDQNTQFRQNQIEQLEDSLNRMASNLEMMKSKQEDLTIRAPISGQLTSLDAEIGESIGPGKRVGQIDVLDDFKVQATIDEHYIARIEPGKTGTFELTGKEYKLVVHKIYPEVRNGEFRIDMAFTDEKPKDIRRGQALHIRLALGDLSEAVLLSKGGFYQTTGGQWVFVVDGSGNTAVKRNIKLGRQNTDVYEVLEGLKPGDKVITTTYENYENIDKLILKNKKIRQD